MINIIAFLGPSGAGKSTLQDFMDIPPIVTWTSRSPRLGEVDGVDYHFTTQETIMRMFEEGLLLEFTQYNGNLYATAAASFEQVIRSGALSSVIVDSNGASELRKKYGERVLVLGVYAPVEECISRLQKRRDPNALERVFTYQEEVQAMQKLADIIVNNAKDNWERSKRLVQLFKKQLFM